MSERVTAMFLVTARGKQNSLSVGVADAAAALAKLRELEAGGFTTVVFDIAGRERSVEELEVLATKEDPQH